MSQADAGGGISRFPETRDSIVAALGDDEPEIRRAAADALVTAYWRPVYTYLRLRFRLEREPAEDATQGFFAHVLEHGTLDRYDPSRARFRTWLRTCLDGFFNNLRKAESRQKRGGDVQHLALEFEDAEGDLRQIPIAAADDPEALFRREWIRGLVALAVDELREMASASGNALAFTIFERYDLEAPDDESRPTYAALADELGVSETKVTNALHSMRRKLRAAILDRLRGLSSSEAEFRAEARELFESRR